MIIGIVVAAVVLVALLVAAKSIKIVREYQRLVLFRLGRAIGTRGPGFVFLNPATDRTTLVDLREQYLEVPHQTAITRDNAPISIDFIIFYKVIDPTTTVLAVGNFSGAALNVAATTLRSVVGDMPLDDVLSKREEMNAQLRIRLDDVTERWGVKVTNVEVREVNPPPSVQEAMTRQMSAERTRRAQVTEAEGSKSAAILAAEGQQQAAVLSAEGQKQANVLAADGERQAALLRAEGYASALGAIFEVAKTLDENTLALQYLDTLRQIGTSPSTKFVVPLEVGNLIAGVRGLVQSQGPPVRPRPEATPPEPAELRAAPTANGTEPEA
jgi:regulator of protease activity HflC (stomatin/prohibitin superfamily)